MYTQKNGEDYVRIDSKNYEVNVRTKCKEVGQS